MARQSTDRVVVDVEHIVMKGRLSPQYYPKGYEVTLVNSVLHDPVIGPKFEVGKLVPHKLLTCPKKVRGAMMMSNEEVCAQAIRFGAYLGFDHGQRMLAEQDKISLAFRKFTIPLPATTILLTFVGEVGVLQLDRKKIRVSPFISYDDNEGLWDMGFNCIDDYCWDDTCCLAVKSSCIKFTR